ncbi:MAG: hypothetical protein KDD50_07420 [Bdellovibrionales bacterium]|nr:hypothetical protein [Bdellovibrionales bacterium]
MISAPLVSQFASGAIVESRSDAEPVRLGSLLDLNQFEPGHPVRENLQSFEEVQELIAQNQVSQLVEKGIVDTFHLIQQTLYIYDHKSGDKAKESHNLADPTTSFKDVVTDKRDLVIENGRLTLKGYSVGHLVARQVIGDFEADRVVYDKDVAIVTTKDGRFYGIDMQYAALYAFKGPIPLFNLLNTVNNSGSELKGFDLSFISRGQQPILVEEVQRRDNSVSAELSADVPRAGNGQPLLKAGDIVVYEKNEADERNFKFILNRHAVLENIKKGTVALSLITFMMNHEGYTTTMGEELQAKLRVRTATDAESPLSLLRKQLGLIGNDPEIDNLLKQVLEGTSEQLEPVKMFFRKLNRKDFLNFLNQASSLASKQSTPRDQFTLEQATASYEKIRQQAEYESKELAGHIERLSAKKERLTIPVLLGRIGVIEASQIPVVQKITAFEKLLVDTANTQVQKTLELKIKSLKTKKSAIDRQIADGNFYGTHHVLARAVITQEVSFADDIKPWYKKMNTKDLKKVAFKLSGIATAGLGISTLGVAAANSAGVSEAFSIMGNWFYLNAVPKVVLENPTLNAYLGEDYRVLLWSGFLKHMAWIPIAHLAGMMSVSFMYVASESLKKVAPGIAYKLNEFADELKPLSTWRRIVTIMMRPYAYAFFPFYNWINKATRQQVMESMKQGINPFLNFYTGNSVYGKNLGLKPGELIFPGFNNPFGSRQKIEAQHNRMQQVRNKVVYERKQAQRVAWLLATLLVSGQADGIDPATQLMIQTGEILPEQLDKIFSDPKLKKQWKRVSAAINSDLWSMIKENKGIDFANLSKEEFIYVFKQAQRINERIRRRPELVNKVVDLKQGFSKNSQLFLSTTAGFGEREFDILKKSTANEFIGSQTAHEFISDHGLLIILNSFFTVRADVHDPANLAYASEGLPKHNTNVTMNFIIHLLMAGPRRVLDFMKSPQSIESNYIPWENTVLSSRMRPENIFKGIFNWSKNIVSSDANIGGFMTYSWLNMFITVQASMGFAFLARWQIGHMEVSQAFMTSYFYWIASIVGFAWPWIVLGRGGSLEAQRLAKASAKFNELPSKIGEAIKLKDEAAVKRYAKELVEALTPGYIADRTVEQSRRSGVSWMDGVILRRQITRLLNAQENQMVEIPDFTGVTIKRKAQAKDGHNIMYAFYGIQYSLNQAQMASDKGQEQTAERYYSEAQRFYSYLKSGVTTGNWSNVSSDFDYEKYALTLAETIQNQPPVANKPNPAMMFSLIFFGGAVGTTWMASELMKTSFNKELLNWNYVQMWTGIHFSYLAATYLLFGKYVRQEILYPAIDKVMFKAHSYYKQRGKASPTVERYLRGRLPQVKKALSCKQIFSVL